jgi:hypothetical protein
MRLKHCLVALPLLAIAISPAAAQEVVFVTGTGETAPVDYYANDSQPDFEDRANGVDAMADRIGSPAVQAGVAATIEQVAGAMLNIPIGPMAEAIERARPGTVRRHIHSDSTIGDIAGSDSRYLPRELGERSHEAMGMMSGFARAMAAMMPEFERIGRDLEESFRTAKAEVRGGRY